MTRYALLLRGVNVGTKNSLPMAELRTLLASLGCTDVQTYVQSGNAVFGTNLAGSALTQAIEKALAAYMGRPIATTLRTLDALNAIVNNNPFVKVATNPARLCVTFLSHVPERAEIAPLHAQEWTPELVKVAGREIFTWHPNGVWIALGAESGGADPSQHRNRHHLPRRATGGGHRGLIGAPQRGC